MKIENLRLKTGSGFTLIELLVVIAILGILMGVVIVGINPTARINEATEAQAKANTQQIATAMEACITKSLGVEASCNTWAKLLAGTFVKAATAPTGIVVGNGCVSAAEAGGLFCKYQSTTGVTACDVATACTAGT